MGVIRGFFAVIVSVLLFLSFFSMILFGILGSSLNYENVEQKAAPLVKASLDEGFNLENEIDSVNPMMQIYCRNNSAAEYVFNSDGYTFGIPCEAVMQGKDAIIDEGIKDLVHKVYYTKYDCGFFNCFRESPFFLVSEKAYNYLNNKFYLFAAVSFILFIALFFFIDKKTSSFIIAGISLIIPSLIFIKLDSLFLSSNQMLFQLLAIFFSESFPVSLNTLIAGISLLIFGIVMKIFKVGFKIQELISKFKQQAEKKPEIKEKPMLKPVKAVKIQKKKKK